MPRANRSLLPGYPYHLTHRCHDRSFLLRFAADRNEYCRQLRADVKEFDFSLLSYTITRNHVHLLGLSDDVDGISKLMQKLEGGFGSYYNRRTGRKGAFWEDRFHATAIESGEHLLRCFLYMDLNMFRAGVVKHPREWAWCAFHELIGERQRYRILDHDALARFLPHFGSGNFAAMYTGWLDAEIAAQRVIRQGIWTEATAVGSESFIRNIARQLGRRKRFRYEQDGPNVWVLREDQLLYEPARR